MIDFLDCLEKIANAAYGKDVRHAIHDALYYLKQNSAGTYTLPAATNDTLGGVKLKDVVLSKFNKDKYKEQVLYVDDEGNVTPIKLGTYLGVESSALKGKTLDISDSGLGWLELRSETRIISYNLANKIYMIKDTLNSGPAGDGVTDDSALLQQIFDVANDNGGGTVIIPKGTYMIGAELGGYLEFYSNMHIYGEPGTVFKFHESLADEIVDGASDKTTGAQSMLRNHTTADVGGYDCTENVIIENITFDCNEAFKKKATVLGIGHAKNIIIRNCKFINGKASDLDHHHYIEINACSHIRIENSTFKSALSPTTRGYCEMVNVDPAAEGSYGWPTHYKYDNTQCQNIEIVGCIFSSYAVSDVPSGYYLSPAIGSHGNSCANNLTIHDCYFYGDWYEGGNEERNWVVRFYGSNRNCRVYNNNFVAATENLASKPIGVCVRCSEKSCFVMNNTFINYDTSNIADSNQSVLVSANNICLSDGEIKDV